MAWSVSISMEKDEWFFFFIVFHFTERASAMVLIILISPAHIKDRNSGETSGLREPSRFLIIGAQHGAGLFRLLRGEHWNKKTFYPCCMEHMHCEQYPRMLLLWVQCDIYSTQQWSEIVMTQQTSRSRQLQRYEEELHHLEQELAGIKMVPGRIYDLRNRAVLRIVSNLSTSSSQSTWAQASPQPQNNLSSARRITKQERVKTPINTTQDGGCGHRLEEFTDRSHRTERDHRNYSCRRKKMWSTHSCLVQGDQPRTEGKYSTRTRAVMRK